MDEEWGEINIEAEEDILLEVDAVAVPQIMVEEVKTQIPVS
jgi:hypothetical protein